jgi:hypothetical protein
MILRIRVLGWRLPVCPGVVFVAACVTPSFGQIFWSNYSPSGVTDGIWCVTYANGTFAAVTDQGNLLTSTNGLNWSSQALDSSVWLVSIAYGNGKWVVVGDKGTILSSSDLQTWVTASSGTTNKLNGVFYNGIDYFAVGENGTILTSSNATTWTLQPSGVTNSLYGFTFFPDFYMPRTPGFIVICGQDGLGLTGPNTVGTDFYVLSNGSYFGTTQDLEAMFNQPSGGGSYITVAVGTNGTILDANSNSAQGWRNATTTPSITTTLRAITFGSGSFVVVGDQGVILTSLDGINWTQRFSGNSPSTLSTATLLSAAYSSTLQRFVVTGTGGTILVSNSPPTVFGNVSTRGYVSTTQTFIGGFVIEGTAPRTVLIRADGPVLSTFGVASPLPDPVLTVYNSSGTVIATNTGWTTNANPGTISTAALEVGAFALPNPSPDAALLLTLQPGAYTAQITSAKGNSGIALFEAYTD